MTFAAKLISLFAGILITVTAIAIWLSEYHLILPLNTLSHSAALSLGSEEERRRSFEKIRSLDIRTGDELENVYHAFTQATEDCINYTDTIQEQAQKLDQMQDGLIMVLADVVESRDQCTGDHIKKTAEYTQVILEHMKGKDKYKDIVTEEYIQSVVRSAPLHDVGKIKIPDSILNKPGKLTDEEFSVMQSHTLEGNEIINEAISLVPDPLYLNETKNMAAYHHEKWNGTGYPYGLSGEEIPLSARVMAVADVFDALVSTRSYKKGFSVDKAYQIIQDGSGTHFDPDIVDAFVEARGEIEEIQRECDREV